MIRPGLLVLFALLAGCGTDPDEPAAPPADQPRLPNIIVIYVDDLGYADVGSYGAVGVETPSIDFLADNGIRLTDAHAAAATCTPSRYALLTGEYGFRSRARVLAGDAPLLIRPGQPTLPAMLREAGYATAVVGKWHLGLGDGAVDWNGTIEPGPLEIGFDYAFLLPATGDRVPTVYVENHSVVGLDPADPITVSYGRKVGDRPTGTENPELLRVTANPQHSATIVNGVSRIGYMAGGESALWIDEEFPDVFTEKALAFIRDNKEGPFFLFHSFHDIHVPRLPHPRFQGKSRMGPRGDAIVQTDWMTGEIVKELEALGIADDTLLIFTSDNGPVLDDGYDDRAVELVGEHNPSGPFRGGKYSAFEAGARVPTIVYWPGTVPSGDSDAVVSQVDFYASLAALIGVELDAAEAIDSRNVLDALLGSSDTGRDVLFKESMRTFSIRRGNLKYIEPLTADADLPRWFHTKDIEHGLSKEPQLYDLSVDIGERNNLAADRPGIVTELQAMLESIKGRTERERK